MPTSPTSSTAPLNAGLTPDQVVAGSNKYRWWRCDKGPDHVWRARVNRRTGQDHGCPACAGRQVSITNSLGRPQFAAIASELDPALNGGLTADQLVAGTTRKVRWRCRYNRDHIWSATVVSRTSGGNGCSRCYNRRSLPELQVAADLGVYFADVDPFADHVPMPGRRGGYVRCDIVLRQQRIVVEYDGSYWHSRPGAADRDRDKTCELLDQGWRVIRVREQPLPAHVCPGHDAVTIAPGDAKAAVTGVLALLEAAGDLPAGTRNRYAVAPGLLRPDVAHKWASPTPTQAVPKPRPNTRDRPEVSRV